MTFLTLNGTTIRARSNGADQTDEEHRLDRERMFDGTIRMTRAGVFRKWSVSTAFLDINDRDTVRALVNGGTILTAGGDLVGDDTPVMPVPGTWTPIQTGDGQRWQGKFSLMETGGPLPPDRSATPWLFYQRGQGYWQDDSRTVPALDGDPVYTWDDKSTNGRHGKADGHLFTGDDCRPTRDDNQLHFGVGPGSPGAGSGRTFIVIPSMSALSEAEMMVSLRATLDPPASTPRSTAWYLCSTGTAASSYPDTDGHIKDSFGRGSRLDAGDPASDLTSLHVYSVSGSTVSRDIVVRLDNVVIASLHTTGGDNFLWNLSLPNFGLGAVTDSGWEGHMQDILVQGVMTDSQRRSWFDYFRGATTEPPLPI